MVTFKEICVVIIALQCFGTLYQINKNMERGSTVVMKASGRPKLIQLRDQRAASADLAQEWPQQV